MNGELFQVLKDGEIMGLIEDEAFICDVLPFFTDDDCVEVIPVNVNRFKVVGANVVDKITEESTLCRDEIIAEELCDKLNEMNTQILRLEAQVRASNL